MDPSWVPSPGTLENKPGCNAEQTLEALVNGELGRIRDLVGGVTGGNLVSGNLPGFCVEFSLEVMKKFLFHARSMEVYGRFIYL